jgi:hypothetical protein
MTLEEFKASLTDEEPRPGVPAPLAALWWDAKGDWSRAHGLVDELETKEAMAVHAYLHRKEGSASNAAYWYERCGSRLEGLPLEDEWTALVGSLVSAGRKD